MNKKAILKSVKDICQDLATNLNYELVDVEYVKESGSYYLRVYVDKPGGITLDDCQIMSMALSEKLDENDPFKEAYYLEVSSPGLDRPLKTDKDLKRNLGKDIEIKLYKALNDRKNYEGKLVEYNNEEIIISSGDENITKIPKEIISLIKLAIKF
ncbi:MAG: ribosome maturation factor RimP [Tissierellia bacterium]|nr:ribosome maturation factor RimP [Tissierellia bacterium]